MDNTTPWELAAFIKIARTGAVCFLPTSDGQFLMQRNGEDDRNPGKLRPPGGGKERQDKGMFSTMIRELHEEFDLDPLDVKRKLKFLGYEYRKPFWGTAVFELRNHGLKPGTYQASNDPDEKVKLVEVDLDHDDYNGPRPEKLITEAAKEKGDALIKKAGVDWLTKLKAEGKPNPYGYCPTCGADVCNRTRGGKNAKDTCENGHEYPSSESVEVPDREQMVASASASDVNVPARSPYPSDNVDPGASSGVGGADLTKVADWSARLARLRTRQGRYDDGAQMDVDTERAARLAHRDKIEAACKPILTAHKGGVRIKGSCGHKVSNPKCSDTLPIESIDIPCCDCISHAKPTEKSARYFSSEELQHYADAPEQGHPDRAKWEAEHKVITDRLDSQWKAAHPNEAKITEAKSAAVNPLMAQIQNGKNLTTAMKAAPLIKTCDTDLVKPMDEFDKSAGLRIPENWDEITEFKTKDFQVYAGANDWENRWSAIAIDFGHGERRTRVWAHLEQPKDDGHKWDGDWGRAVFKHWLKMADVLRKARARECGIDGYVTWKADDFLEAAQDVKEITDSGLSKYVWEDVEKTAAANPGLAASGASDVAPGEPKRPVPVNFQGLPPTTGPEAIGYALSKLDLNKMEEESRDIVKRKLKSKRPLAVKRLGYIQGFQRSGITPADLMISRVPVIPPQFRPYSVAGETFIPGDANELYRDLINMTGVHEELRKHLGNEGVKANKLRIYDAARAVYGFGEPVSPKTKERGVSGFLQKLVGSNPKHSLIQRKLLSRDMDFVGRGVIGLNPDLGMDEIGIPESAAWKPYGPYVQRRLIRSGMSREGAVQEIEKQSDVARKALETEMRERPVMYSRAPAWHKFSAIGGWPKLVKGNTIMVNPLVTTGLTADFDGDDQNGKVYILRENTACKSDEANEKSYLTLPLSGISIASMIKNQIIPTLNTTTYHVAIMDLADFPHGKLLSTKQGEKGPIELYEVSGIKVLALDETTGQPVWADVSHYSVHADREVEVVNTVLNRQLVTDDDPRAIYGIPGDSLEYSRFTPTEAEARNVAIPFLAGATEAVAEALETLTEVTVTENKDCTFHTLQLNSDFGYLLGSLCGDGWWDKRDHEYYRARSDMYGLRSINLADHKGFNANKVEAVLRAIAKSDKFYTYRLAQTKAENPNRYGDSVKHTYNFQHSEILAAFLSKHMGGEGDEQTSGAANKRLPGFAYAAPREFRAALLCGLIDTDGTCNNCVGHDGVAQFQTSITSTSLRLVRDVQFLALTLGIRSNLSFSKTTSAGNSAWLLTFAAADIKRSPVLSGLQCPWKREAWEKGMVDCDGPSGQRSNRVPMPKAVVEVLKRKLISPKITNAMRKLGGPELEGKTAAANLWQRVHCGQKENSISRSIVARILEAITTQESRDTKLVEVARDVLRTAAGTGTIDRAGVQYVRDALAAVAPFYGDANLVTASRKIQACLNKPLKTGRIGRSTVEYADTFLASTPLPDSVLKHPLVVKWLDIVNNESISWTTIKSVEKTGKRETGYDLTVPGYETFINADGIVLSNTMNFHVPALPEAVNDVKEKLMPSKMLWSMKKRDTVVPVPKHEAILGLNNARTRPAQKRWKFPTEEAALSALRKGDIRVSDEVVIVP